MDVQYNVRSPAVKRLMREAQEMKERTELYYAQPLEDNLFEWHFTVRGPPDTEFAGGVYHGRIILPTEYPMKPPSIMMLTPNGRFELQKKICLSISGYHPESWQPSWSIRTALLAIIGFMPTHGAGAIGALDYTPEERKSLARKSHDWKCSACDVVLRDVLLPITDASKATTAEAKEIAQQYTFKEDKPASSTASLSSLDDELNVTSETSTSEPTSSPTVDDQPDTQLRHRSIPASSPIAQMRPRPIPGPNEMRAQAVGTGNILMIVVVTLALAVLLLRRFYVINEWRFNSANDIQ